MSQATTRRYLLPEEALPTHYYNIAADLPEPLPPPLHPATREPVGPADLAPLFPMELIKQFGGGGGIGGKLGGLLG